MIIVCEQCNGTGYLPKGQRCPCREEDDEAQRRRERMKLVYSVEVEVDRAPGFMKRQKPPSV